MQTFRYGPFAQIRFYQYLAVYSRIFREDLFELDHQSGIFAKQLEDLLRSCRRTAKVIFDDICGRRSHRKARLLGACSLCERQEQQATRRNS